jgi:uncharacterized protein YdaU (DUF1376 family)
MNGLPYFPMYASDFLSGVADMPLDDRGAYITLICHQWVNGSVPSDIASCSRICGGGTVSERVLAKFRNVDGTPTMANARLERERVKCIEAREKAKKRKTKWKERGRNANGTRSGTVSDTSRERLGSDSDSLSSLDDRKGAGGNTEANQRNHKKPKPDEEFSEDFKVCWKAYPDKSGSKYKAWLSFKAAGATSDVVLLAIERYIAYVESKRNSGFRDLKYKNGETWFNQRGWLTEYETTNTRGKDEFADTF